MIDDKIVSPESGELFLYLVTASWLAQKMNISSRTLKRWVANGEVPLYTYKFSGRHYYDRKQAQDFVAHWRTHGQTRRIQGECYSERLKSLGS
ncbi:MAG: hypothetical protein IKJ98_03390 [Bacteroidales bacterium]|nr:hypothetical protein [Bacteroidales bacterium]